MAGMINGTKLGDDSTKQEFCKMEEIDNQLLEKIFDAMENCLDDLDSVVKSMEDEQSIDDLIIA